MAKVLTLTTTGNIDDLPIGLCHTIRMNNATLATIRGIAAGFHGQRITIVSVGAGQVDLAHQNAGSAAANRLLNFVTSASTPLSAGVGTATYQYDATTARWRLTDHVTGAWLTPTFAAGDYTGFDTMTWTVAAGDVFSIGYTLTGRVITLTVDIRTTTVGGTPTGHLLLALPGGLIAARTVTGPMFYSDNAGAVTLGQVSAIAADDQIQFYKLDSSAWAAATDATRVFGTITFEVQ